MLMLPTVNAKINKFQYYKVFVLCSILLSSVVFKHNQCGQQQWRDYYTLVMVDPLKVFWVLTNSTYLGWYNIVIIITQNKSTTIFYSLITEQKPAQNRSNRNLRRNFISTKQYFSFLRENVILFVQNLNYLYTCINLFYNQVILWTQKIEENIL